MYHTSQSVLMLRLNLFRYVFSDIFNFQWILCRKHLSAIIWLHITSNNWTKSTRNKMESHFRQVLFDQLLIQYIRCRNVRSFNFNEIQCCFVWRRVICFSYLIFVHFFPCWKQPSYPSKRGCFKIRRNRYFNS